MSDSERLRKQRLNTIINQLSKKQDAQLEDVVELVQEELEKQFPNFELVLRKQWKLSDIVENLRKHFPDVEFYCEHKTSYMKPDGGILCLRGKNNNLYPILISERKNQGTNKRRAEEGLKKQAKGNAIERLGKNVIGFRTALLMENIFPFVCFGDGCDFEPESSIVDRVTTIAMFGRLNKIHLHNEKTIFNRGSFYFRGEEWTAGEMFEICLDIAVSSTHYYISKYDDFKQ